MNLLLRLLLVRMRSRKRGRISLWDTAVTPFRVAPTDLDLLLHMNNGKYLSILDVGRMDLMIRSGFWDVLKERGWYPVVAGQTITYRRSLKLGQSFEVHTRVLGFDERWGFIEQTFTHGETIYAHAIIRTRFLKKSGGSVDHADLEEAAGGFPTEQHIPQWVRAWSEANRIPTSTM
ncbi:acyl-CoA thioester hydrolase, YbgC/YbaW family [Ruaniaceae bacterium KH17]|nr:acyl-CoA thioester hydrolase, YbgC/YbaW family [Ruaniaceae bacterium KH17]